MVKMICINYAEMAVYEGEQWPGQQTLRLASGKGTDIAGRSQGGFGGLHITFPFKSYFFIP